VSQNLTDVVNKIEFIRYSVLGINHLVVKSWVKTWFGFFPSISVEITGLGTEWYCDKKSGKESSFRFCALVKIIQSISKHL
jgi:hypothetical protein